MADPIYTKKCSKCNEIKPIGDFKQRSDRVGKYTPQCITCINKENREKYKNSIKIREKLQIASKEYYTHNREKCKIDRQLYRKSTPSYLTYSRQLTIDEDSRLSDDGISLEVKCKYCREYFSPTNSQVNNRILSINGKSGGENNVYCSVDCKKSCETYRQRKNIKKSKENTSPPISFTEKKCSKCGEIKPISDFRKRKERRLGYQSHCNECVKQRQKSRYPIVKDKLNEDRRQYRINNPTYTKLKNEKIIKAFAIYDTYKNQLTIEEEPTLSADSVFLECRCKYCGDYFIPTSRSVIRRVQSIKGIKEGDNNLYCSDNCKKSCGTYNQKFFPKNFKVNTSREVQPQLRKMVLALDNYTCQICGNTKEDAQLHCHHTEGVEINPIESADIDKCITLCKKCHNKTHKNCDMKRKKCKV